MRLYNPTLCNLFSLPRSIKQLYRLVLKSLVICSLCVMSFVCRYRILLRELQADKQAYVVRRAVTVVFATRISQSKTFIIDSNPIRKPRNRKSIIQFHLSVLFPRISKGKVKILWRYELGSDLHMSEKVVGKSCKLTFFSNIATKICFIAWIVFW